MKTIIISLAIGLSLFLVENLNAQTIENQDKNNPLEYFNTKKEEIIQQEKQKLKDAVESINSRLERGNISESEAGDLKNAAAEKHAKNIENRIVILKNEMELRERNDEVQYIAIGENGKAFNININREKYDKRTVSDLVIAAGFNNALEEGQSLNDSDFKLAGSRFFEIGWAWKTRVFQKTNWLRFRYGLSLQFNGLKPTDNRYFIQDGEETFLSEFDYDLDKSKFRMDNLVVPVHFEIGPSTRNEYEDKVRFSTAGKLKIGLGGYAGFNIGERQKLKYEIDGDKQKDKLKAGYNTNDLVYGLSAYLGWGGATLYGKYDLNPIFESPNTELHNFSLGLRFDVD